MTIVAPTPRDRFGLLIAAAMIGLAVGRQFVDEPAADLVLIGLLILMSAFFVVRVVRDLRNARPRH